MAQCTMNPATWDQEQVREYLVGGADLRAATGRSARSTKAVVLGSTGSFGQLAGRHALELGGSAVDAAITTSLTQIALAAGSWVSYAGLFTMVHFEASTGDVTSLSGGFRTFKGETDAATIPMAPAPSGRTALVPGFLAGIYAAHQRFGRLPWADLFEPAIYVAEEGFFVGKGRDAHFSLRADVLARTPEGKAIFFNGDGELPKEGDTFRQPALAATLRRIAADGDVDHIYKGEWANKFVELVNREGGNASIEDLATYDVVWSDPIQATVFGYDVRALGAPDDGGETLVNGLRLAEEAGIVDADKNPESLYWSIQIPRQTPQLMHFPAEIRRSPEFIRHVWKEMQAAGKSVGPGRLAQGTHSDFALAADADGNVVAVCHSINTSLWGTTGIFVDGISIPDAACFQQQELAAITPGDPLPNPTNPTIVLRNGKPVLASSSIGAGLVHTTFQCVHAALAQGKTVDEIAVMPLCHGADLLRGDSVNSAVTAKEDAGSSGGAASAITDALARITAAVTAEIEAGADPADAYLNVVARIPEVAEEGFDPELLAAVQERGQALSIRKIDDPTIPRGYWGGISINQSTGELIGGRTAFLNGSVEAL